MLRSRCRPFIGALAIAILLLAPFSQGIAQDGTPPPGPPTGADERTPGRELLLQAVVGRLPDAPATIRLSRLTLDPGASSTDAGSPGPAFVLVESGSLLAEVDAPAILLPAGDVEGSTPVSGAFTAGLGDRLALPVGTAYSFRNDGTEPAVTLVAAILPAGANAAGPVATPAAGAGVTVRSLGEGVAPTLPVARAAVTLERFVLTAGLGVPAYPGPVLVAVESGGFASTLDAGNVQLSAAGRPGVRPTVAPGQAFELAAGDAIFFPEGMAATPPLAGDGTLVLLRLGILPVAAATPEAVDSAVDPTTFAVGATVVVTAPGLRLRAAAQADGAILAELAAGQVLVVTGPPIEGSGLVWYPVQDPNNPALAGYVAADFVAPLE